MKKMFVALTAILTLTAGITIAQEADFYDDAGGLYYPLQLSLYPTLQLIDYNNDVAGLRLNLIGVNGCMTGLDVGIINQTDHLFTGAGIGIINLCQGDSRGVDIGFINHVNGNVTGFQGIPLISWWNALNIVHGKCVGAQGGLVNQSKELVGVQCGLVNVAYDAKGVMAGIYNYSENFSGLDLGLINIAYENMTGAQIGIYNGVRNANGFQLGVINQCQNLSGLQIGLVNIASQKNTAPTMIFANWQF